MLASVDGQLTALPVPASTDIANKGLCACVDVLMLAVILLGRQDFMADLALKLVEVWMGVGHMPAHIVFGGVDVLAARHLATKASVFHQLVIILPWTQGG
jgi:hypothetical protein